MAHMWKKARSSLGKSKKYYYNCSVIIIFLITGFNIMNDIYDEAKEALEKEKANKLWHDNKYYIIFSITFIILFTAGVNAYKGWNNSEYEKDTAILLNILDASSSESEQKSGVELAKELEIVVPELRPEHRATALFGAFTEYAKANDFDQAINSLISVYKDNAIEKDMRDYAVLIASGYYIDNIDSLMPEDNVMMDIRVRLETVAQNRNSPWFSKALLNCALWSMYIDKKAENAVTYLDVIINSPNLSDAEKRRAEEVKIVYMNNIEDKG